MAYALSTPGATKLPAVRKRKTSGLLGTDEAFDLALQQRQMRATGTPTTPKQNLEQQLTGFYQQQVGAGFSGSDPVTQANLQEYDWQAQQARKQQVEDLNRFGVIGGQGVSAGATADVLGTFDAGVLRGRSGVLAQGQQNLMSQVLPQAQGLAQYQGTQATQKEQFGQTLTEQQREFNQAQRLATEQLYGGTGGERISANTLGITGEQLGTFPGQFAAIDAMNKTFQEAYGRQPSVTEREALLRGETITVPKKETLAAQQFTSSQQEAARQFNEQQRAQQTAMMGTTGGTVSLKDLGYNASTLASSFPTMFQAIDTIGAEFQKRFGRAPSEAEIISLLQGQNVTIQGQQTLAAQGQAQQYGLQQQQLGLQQAGLFGTTGGAITLKDLGFNPATIASSFPDMFQAMDAIGTAFQRQFGRAPTNQEGIALLQGSPVNITGQQTLAAQQLAEQKRAATAQESLAQQQLYGGGPYQPTLAARELELARGLGMGNLDLAKAELLGQYQGQQTLQARSVADQLALQQAGVTGEYQGQQTIATELARQQAAMQEAGITGTYQGAQTLAAQDANRMYQLQRAELFGGTGGTVTLQDLGFDPATLSSSFPDTFAAMDAISAEFQTRFGRAPTNQEGIALLQGSPVNITGQQTLAAQQMAQQNKYQEAGLTGLYGDTQTLAGQQAAMARQALTAELLGQYQGQQTIQAKTLAEQLAQSRAGLTGLYGDTQTLAGQQLQLARQTAGAELTGQYQGQDTLAKQAMSAALTGTYGGQDTMAREALLAELTGMYGGQKTQTAKTQAEQLAQSLAGLTGMYGETQTLGGQQMNLARNTARDQLELQQAGVTGQYQGRDTMAQQALLAELTGMYGGQSTLAKQLAEAQLTGRYNGLTTADQAYRQDQVAMQIAGLTGQYQDAPTMAQQALEAELLGTYGGQETLGAQQLGQQNERDILAIAIAAREAGLDMSEDQISTLMAAIFGAEALYVPTLTAAERSTRRNEPRR
uniref:Uncharacterized protein n=1 Tax=viral metagenome TaxID=1070528 RepID=A0A6M3IFF9_9ZZZZ